MENMRCKFRVNIEMIGDTIMSEIDLMILAIANLYFIDDIVAKLNNIGCFRVEIETHRF